MLTAFRHILLTLSDPRRAWAEALEQGSNYRFWAVFVTTALAFAVAFDPSEAFLGVEARSDEIGRRIPAAIGYMLAFGAAAVAFGALWILQAFYLRLSSLYLGAAGARFGLDLNPEAMRSVAALLLISQTVIWIAALAAERWAASIPSAAETILFTAQAISAPIAYFVIRAAFDLRVRSAVALALCPMVASLTLVAVASVLGQAIARLG